MSAYRFSSCLAAQMDRFINLRRLSGTDYHSQTRLLEYFDRFLVQQGFNRPHITREITDSYQQGLTTLAPRTQSNRMCVLRQFCEYLAGSNPQSYVPGPLPMIRSHRAHKPYIYNSEQIRALMAAASRLLPLSSLRPHTYRTLLGLLYTTGIRIGEAIALNLQDVQPSTQWLYIAEGKFRKARWVALSNSTARALQHYIDTRFKSARHSPDSPLLLNNRRRRLCYPTVNQTFRGLLQKCDIPHNKRTGPHIHDMRHTFAVHRLLAWYRQGQDVNAKLPALATYMGHVDISSTHIYLQPTAELLEQVHQRFHNYYLNNIDPKGGQS
ncbi:MAG: tyrosine-type recombinase/integrase [Deltaproteobacteria bacterium]|nr:tyrosine-type recombinase/integrase [Deltaproteobacteria bacterium]